MPGSCRGTHEHNKSAQLSKSSSSSTPSRMMTMFRSDDWPSKRPSSTDLYSSSVWRKQTTADESAAGDDDISGGTYVRDVRQSTGDQQRALLGHAVQQAVNGMRIGSEASESQHHARVTIRLPRLTVLSGSGQQTRLAAAFASENDERVSLVAGQVAALRNVAMKSDGNGSADCSSYRLMAMRAASRLTLHEAAR